jgi:hypothetical protein
VVTLAFYIKKTGLVIIPRFPYNHFAVSCGDIGFLYKKTGLVSAWKSGLEMPLGLSYPLQTILLSGLVGRLVHFFKI